MKTHCLNYSVCYSIHYTIYNRARHVLGTVNLCCWNYVLWKVNHCLGIRKSTLHVYSILGNSMASRKLLCGKGSISSAYKWLLMPYHSRNRMKIHIMSHQLHWWANFAAWTCSIPPAHPIHRKFLHRIHDFFSAIMSAAVPSSQFAPPLPLRRPTLRRCVQSSASPRDRTELRSTPVSYISKASPHRWRPLANRIRTPSPCAMMWPVSPSKLIPSATQTKSNPQRHRLKLQCNLSATCSC